MSIPITMTGGQFIYGVQWHENKCSTPYMTYTYDIGFLDAPDSMAAGSMRNTDGYVMESTFWREL